MACRVGGLLGTDRSVKLAGDRPSWREAMSQQNLDRLEAMLARSE
jgi:hypothetical protein